MAARKPDLLQGTLDLLILKALAAGALHGWAISKRIEQMSREVLTATQGSLYPALYRLEDRGWIAGAEAQSA
jgi:DNA-binding PadR family transcriptional regulator